MYVPSSETSVDFYKSTQRHSQEDKTLQMLYSSSLIYETGYEGHATGGLPYSHNFIVPLCHGVKMGSIEWVYQQFYY
jgi:hypothetical protein